MQTQTQIDRDNQRSESEARDIIHDIARLYTFDEERKTRWVWELLQNAKDVATPEGVDIIIRLSNNQLTFSHNGQPFTTLHLLALLYKTSTKSLNGEGGTTGKYGTGFVTTHILSTKLKIAGVHIDKTGFGKRRFELVIDRSSANLDESIALKAMKESLAKTFSEIDKVNDSPATEVTDNFNSFIYELTPSSYTYAERGLQELERSITFTLLANKDQEKKINSVTIETLEKTVKFESEEEPTSLEGIKYVKSTNNKGILFQKTERLIFGIPVINTGKNYKLLRIEKQPILFKEFPLIGTENFNLPVFIQHSDFHPTEERDGIRTKKESEDAEDPHAEKNRNALANFVEVYILFIKKIVEANVLDVHCLAKSGLPDLIEKYSNPLWYKENIQGPIRQQILQFNVVQVAAGPLIKIDQAIFPSSQLGLDNDFFSLLSRLLPYQVPNNESIEVWNEAISQEPDNWPGLITINQEQLVNLVKDKVELSEEKAFIWLKDLYRYLDSRQLTLGEIYPIYANEDDEFCLRDEVKLHPVIDEEFKKVSKGLGRPLNKEFLNRKLGAVASVKPFDLNEFYKNINNELINGVKVESATLEQIQAIFHICCLFRSDRATKRENWYKIINELLPLLTPEKKTITIDYENYWRSAELWSIKYICHLIERAVRPTAFAIQYFQGNEEICFKWLKSFLSFVFSIEEESRNVILKKKIIPTQADEFHNYDDNIYLEQDSKYFDDEIKNIYRDYIKKGDPKRFIVDNRIRFDDMRSKDVSILTNEIDNIFLDAAVESKVKVGGTLNEMFLKLNDWFEQFSNADTFLKTFSTKRATLYILALGEGFSKHIMKIKESGKSIEDIAELAKIKLSTEDLKKIDNAVAILGADKLLAKAQEMINAQIQIKRWKEIGTVAEDAFREAIAEIDINFEIGNPDLGKDFELMIKSKNYSIEIKNVIEGKENVRMSIKQGKTAVDFKDSYALCVMTRPSDDAPIDKEYFKNNARFVPTIGSDIGDKIFLWDQGLRNLETDTDIKVQLLDKTESVYISRGIWKDGKTFSEFVTILKQFFSDNETN